MRLNKSTQRFLLGALLASVSPWILETRLNVLRQMTLRKAPIDEALIPSAPVIRGLALGHREWAADLYWISGLVYFGESSSLKSAQRYLESYARVTEEIDPDFRHAYLWGATVSIYSHRRISRASVERSIGHLERGLVRFPHDSEMLYQLGFDYWFELPPYLPDPAERLVARRRGAEFLRQAASAGYGPQWLVLAAASTLDDVGQNESGLEMLRTALLQTDDPEMRARIARRIQALSPDAAQDPGLVAAQATERERVASYAYVQPALYLFVGAPLLHPGATAR